MVLAQAAGLAGCLHTEAVEVGQLGKGGLGSLIVKFGGQGCPVGSHEAGNRGTHDLAVGEQFECTQHRIIQESAALDDNLVAEVGGVLELDDLVERITHHRVGQARGDIANVGPLFLRLLHR